MFCGKCGNELPDDAKFCGKCGNRIEEKNEALKEPENLPNYNETADMPIYNGEDGGSQLQQTVYIPKETKQETFKKEEVKVKKKKSIALPLIICIVALLIVALGILAFVFKDDIFGEESSEEDSRTNEGAGVSFVIESDAESDYGIDETSVEESEPDGIVFGDSGISNGQWTLSTDNGSYELLLKLDGRAKLVVTNKGGSVVNFESKVRFVSDLSNAKDVLDIGEGEELGIFTDYRKNQIAIKYNNKYIILFHSSSQKIMPNEALSGFWRKGTDSFAIDEEYITFKGDKNRYLALDEKNFYVYDRMDESEFVFNGDIGSHGTLTECIIDENGYLDLFYAGVNYSNLRHVE